MKSRVNKCEKCVCSWIKNEAKKRNDEEKWCEKVFRQLLSRIASGARCTHKN